MKQEKKFIYACPWEKDRMTSWSGTHYAIYSRLKGDFQLMDFDYGIHSPYAFVNKLLHKCHFLSFSKMNQKIKGHFGEKIDRKFDIDIPCLQFEELESKTKRNTFCYQDLSILYLKYLKENEKNIFDVSGFQFVDDMTMKDWCASQLEYYKNSNTTIFTMGHWLREYLIKKIGLPEQRVIYCGGGYNVDSNKIKPNRNGKTFLYVGKDYVRKNLPLIMEAFKLVHERDKETRLLIAGPKNFQINQDGVINKGLISFSEVSNLFNQSDVFVMPSLFEAYGLVFPEALTYGLPCIGRDAYEMPYFIQNGKTGYLLKNQNADELADLMMKALTNQEMRQEVERKKEFYLTEYSWDTVVDRMVETINSRGYSKVE